MNDMASIGTNDEFSSADGDLRVDRKSVRELIKRMIDEVESAKMSGENEHQLRLDQMDWISENIARFPQEKQDEFWNVYLEEQNAFYDNLIDKLERENSEKMSDIARMEAESSRIMIENEETEKNFEVVGGIVGFAILVFILIAVFSR